MSTNELETLLGSPNGQHWIKTVLGVLVGGLEKLLTTQQMADMMNAIVSAEASPEISNAECQVLIPLFDVMFQQCPEVVKVAQDDYQATQPASLSAR
ncbi:MAG: hypothetical protein R3B84_09810 [Zavarzinella sp.]